MALDIKFTDFKNYFYSKVTDFSIFNCQEFNLLKVVLEGLVVNYNKSSQKVRNYVFYPLWFFQLILLIKRFKKKNLIKSYQKELELQQQKENLIIDVGRIVFDENNQPLSTYFHNIINKLGKENTTLIIEEIIHKNVFYNFYYKDLAKIFYNSKLTDENKLLRKELIRVFNLIKSKRIFNSGEMENIKIAFNNFFNHYRIWDVIIKALKPQKAFFVCHYHKEGCILALRRNNVKTIELQHGLIAPQDIFYCFPPQVKSIANKALFADKIYTYGKYWKEILLTGVEYSEKQIEILGYFVSTNSVFFENDRIFLDNLCLNKKVILITTQNNITGYFIKYIENMSLKLAQTNPEYIIVVKPHHGEKSEAYKKLETAGNVFVLNINTDILYKYAEINISVYSTTLFEAYRHSITCFALKAEQYIDYVATIINSGIAFPLEFDQNPVEELKKINKTRNSFQNIQFFFSDFNPERL